MKAQDEKSIATKYLAVFDENPFYGEMYSIKSKKDLYQIVYDRTYLIGSLNDFKGQLRDEDCFREDELIDIYREARWAKEVHLVNSLDELQALSDHPRYQRMFAEFIAAQ
ncbi:hypothetical protein QUN99_003434 [Vibrio parahaemolyticus]|nr:hypothetical protein [Vibrio parahaemolyticus]